VASWQINKTEVSSMSTVLRQGDLLFTKIDKIPSGVFASTSNVILRGEATGHAHKIENGRIFNRFDWSFRQIRTKNEIFIEAKKNARIVHEEHGTLELEAGFYLVIRQREFMTLDNQKQDWQYIRD
jgi:hypothetical protein